MKESFDVVIKVPLETYFLEFLDPKLRRGNLKDSKKIDAFHSLREYLGLVLLSYFLSELNNKKFVPAINNNNYDDGVICNLKEQTFYPIEQTYVYENKWDNDVTKGIIDVLGSKLSKGSPYAKNTWLLIYCNANGDLKTDSIKNQLETSVFPSIVFIGPEGSEEYSYRILLAKDGDKIINETYVLRIDKKGLANLL